MKEVTSPARRKWSFPSPVDVHCERSDEQKDENDERPATLQSTKLWPGLPAHKSYCGAIAVDRPLKMYFWIFPVAVLGSSLTRSEERRVGKECRSLWSAEHVKKKHE